MWSGRKIRWLLLLDSVVKIFYISGCTVGENRPRIDSRISVGCFSSGQSFHGTYELRFLWFSVISASFVMFCGLRVRGSPVHICAAYKLPPMKTILGREKCIFSFHILRCVVISFCTVVQPGNGPFPQSQAFTFFMEWIIRNLLDCAMVMLVRHYRLRELSPDTIWLQVRNPINIAQHVSLSLTKNMF